MDVQRVEIGAQTNGGARTTVAENAYDARPRESCMHVEAERTQRVGDESARDGLLERGLRVRVQTMAPAAHFGVERGDFGDDVHGASLWR